MCVGLLFRGWDQYESKYRLLNEERFPDPTRVLAFVVFGMVRLMEVGAFLRHSRSNDEGYDVKDVVVSCLLVIGMRSATVIQANLRDVSPVFKGVCRSEGSVARVVLLLDALGEEFKRSAELRRQ